MSHVIMDPPGTLTLPGATTVCQSSSILYTCQYMKQLCEVGEPAQWDSTTLTTSPSPMEIDRDRCIVLIMSDLI